MNQATLVRNINVMYVMVIYVMIGGIGNEIQPFFAH